MQSINLKPRQSGGSGGLWGSIFGGFAGAAAAPFTGGASLAAVPALMGAGSLLGGTIGGAVDPAKVSSRQALSPLETAAKMDPEVQLAQLIDANKALWEEPGIPVNQKRELESTAFAPARLALDEILKRRG